MSLTLARYFLAGVVLAVVVISILMLRLDKRISRGAVSAGPMAVPPAPVPGLKATAWDLAGIEAELRARPESAVDMARQLATSAGVVVVDPGWSNHPDARAANMLGQIEEQLGIEQERS